MDVPFETQDTNQFIDRTPMALATIVVVAASALYALNKMNFRFNFGASVGS